MRRIEVHGLSCILLALGLAFASACGDTGGDDTQGADIVFSNFIVSNLDATRADIHFNTDVPIDCMLEYDVTTDPMAFEARDPDMEEGALETNHNVPLEDLRAGTVYYYRVRGSLVVDGPVQYSEPHSFQTPSTVDPTEGKTNYALLANGASVTEVSSNYFGAANDETWGINSAFDDSMSSEWSSDNDGTDAYVVLDLGQMRTITTFGFRSRKMLDGTSIALAVQLRVGDQVIGPFETDNPDQRYLFDLDTPISTRTIRVEYTDSTGGNTGAKEIQFYGAE